ncbi:methyl-accepting chemotaxis protein [Desulfobaculum xiamenense]|uniref:Methyl-accepting chemotaxis protein n=1 Tax=Desulfobaculum xiamenense TaxID=995050 RepID=A0A846QRD8_9BACT|nr:methyl-accepting chemotaxis protein [Desulfobaculum xiamenense]NJB68933.1 methyl-accepting chemotaxis protein [Desulfobaculum xiamenense]
MGTTVAIPASRPSILILAAAIAVLCIAAGAAGSLLAGGVAALIGLVLALALFLRAKANDRSTSDQLELLHRDIEAYRQESVLLSRALEAADLPMAVCADAETLWAASTSMAKTIGAHSASELRGLSLREVFGERIAMDIARQGGHGVIEGTLEASGAPVRIHIGRDRDTGVFVLQLADMKKEANACDEIAKEREQFKKAAESINQLAQRLASSSELMSAHADEQAAGSKRQKEQTQAVAHAVERMMEAVLLVAQNATATSEVAEEARTEAVDGVELVKQAVARINALSESAKGLAKELAELDTRAGEIGRIIGVINDIADQTNLLALNAAIEAARAGDAGRGFAVVADEVRKLAEKTMDATKEVERAIRTIQNSAKSAVDSMTVTGKQVEESTDLSNRAGHSLEKVMGSIDDMVGRVAHIATAADEQSSHAEEISRSVDDIADIARDADEGAAQQAFATRDLAKLSSELLSLSSVGGARDAAHHARRKGEGMMKGVLPKLMHDFVKEQLGDKALKAVETKLGDIVFLPTESYPDHLLVEMADAAAEATGMRRDEVLRKLGLFTIGGFHKLYRRYFKAKTLKDFLMSMNDTHADVIRDMPGVIPPRFTFEDKGKVLFMNYKSKRALFSYFHGIIEGAAAFYKESVTVKLKPLDKETARAEIHFNEH